MVTAAQSTEKPGAVPAHATNARIIIEVWRCMTWEVEYTDQFGAWWLTVTASEQSMLDATVTLLTRHGPTLGRPSVDTIKGSKHPNMKELRPRGSNLRVLFAFDPHRVAILLIGGDKTGRWQEWYDAMIPVADALYDEHLREIQQEGRA